MPSWRPAPSLSSAKPRRSSGNCSRWVNAAPNSPASVSPNKGSSPGHTDREQTITGILSGCCVCSYGLFNSPPQRGAHIPLYKTFVDCTGITWVSALDCLCCRLCITISLTFKPLGLFDWPLYNIYLASTRLEPCLPSNCLNSQWHRFNKNIPQWV